MKKVIIILIILILILIFAICIKNFYTKEETINIENGKTNDTVEEPKSIIQEVDWSKYFDGINGAGVIYNPTENYYQIYNSELANVRRSPCSTFKIISSTIAIEHEILDLDNSTKVWSGEKFWNENWNKNIDFTEAFQTSCVWYFRELIDEIGKDLMQTELNKLKYGNCDITDWNGKQNTNNDNPALTGFWIESSLKISPKEQVEVLERIFGNMSEYSEETQKQLEQVMFVKVLPDSDTFIYGKTGMGKDKGVVVDSWFTGFADTKENGRIYFSIYLGETNNKNVSSTKAKEIAITLINELSLN